MTDLSPTAKNALAALRARDALDPVAKTRVRARIDASIAAGAGEARTAGRLDAKGIAIRIALPVAIAASVLLVLRALAPSGDASRETSRDRGQAAYEAAPDREASDARERPIATEPEAAPREPVASAEPELSAPLAPPEPPATASRRKPPRDRPAASADAPADADTTLAEELRLLARARAALRDGDPDRALAALRRHADGFADGQMGEDRDALRVEALCAADRGEEAARAAAAFARAWPTSPHRARVAKICATK